MTFVEILQKALSDPTFRNLVIRDPKAALKAAGVKATPSRIQALKDSAQAIISARELFDGDDNI
jgi:hypothetical protein